MSVDFRKLFAVGCFGLLIPWCGMIFVPIMLGVIYLPVIQQHNLLDRMDLICIIFAIGFIPVLVLTYLGCLYSIWSDHDRDLIHQKSARIQELSEKERVNIESKHTLHEYLMSLIIQLMAAEARMAKMFYHLVVTEDGWVFRDQGRSEGLDQATLTKWRLLLQQRIIANCIEIRDHGYELPETNLELFLDIHLGDEEASDIFEILDAGLGTSSSFGEYIKSRYSALKGKEESEE